MDERPGAEPSGGENEFMHPPGAPRNIIEFSCCVYLMVVVGGVLEKIGVAIRKRYKCITEWALPW